MTPRGIAGRVLLLLLLTTATCAAAPEAAPQRIDPAAGGARLLRAQAGHAVWLLSALHPETTHHRAQTFTHRLYRQRLDQPHADLVLEHVDKSVRLPVAIRDDGSVLMSSRRGLHFVPQAGPAVEHDVPGHGLLALYPDGALLEDTTVRHPQQLRPVYFVPFEGDRLHPDRRVQVVQDGVKRFTSEQGLGYPGEPYRFGDLFAWVAAGTLHTFDLKSGERKSTLLAADLHPSYRVAAFDGATVVCSIYAFDASTGELLGEARINKRPKNVAAVFAVRNRIGYYYERGGLRATDLTARDGASVELGRAEPIVPMQGDDGLTVWDGKRWQLVPWLKDLRSRP